MSSFPTAPSSFLETRLIGADADVGADVDSRVNIDFDTDVAG